MISDLQHGAYPLYAPKNESFPDTYISTRHDLIKTVFNQTVSNGTVQLRNPLIGTWFLMVNKKNYKLEINCYLLNKIHLGLS